MALIACNAILDHRGEIPWRAGYFR